MEHKKLFLILDLTNLKNLMNLKINEEVLSGNIIFWDIIHIAIKTQEKKRENQSVKTHGEKERIYLELRIYLEFNVFCAGAWFYVCASPHRWVKAKRGAARAAAGARKRQSSTTVVFSLYVKGLWEDPQPPLSPLRLVKAKRESDHGARHHHDHDVCDVVFSLYVKGPDEDRRARRCSLHVG